MWSLYSGRAGLFGEGNQLLDLEMFFLSKRETLWAGKMIPLEGRSQVLCTCF